jgi:two-component system phosphate regulon sensor histidine kinase PhoR
MLFIVLSIFVLAFVILFTKYLHMVRQLKKMSIFLDQISQGNLNQRLRLHDFDSTLFTIGSQLNSMVEQFLSIQHKAHYLEETRQKVISNISHDLITPLTALLGYIDALINDDELCDEERDNFLAVVSQKASRLYALLNNFFELVKLEADDTVLELQQIDLAEKARESVLLFYPDFPEALIKVELSIPAVPLFVWGDPYSIERILHNLLANAFRYGKDGGIVGLKLLPASDKVWVEIWDHGKGISQKDLPYIFDRLYTTEASRNRGFQGNGLGLTITKRLVEKQHGQIQVTSSPNVKTSFAFCLTRCK